MILTGNYKKDKILFPILKKLFGKDASFKTIKAIDINKINQHIYRFPSKKC